MNPYQQKWISLLTAAHIPGWKIEPQDNNIYVEMPEVTDLKIIKDNLPETLGAIALDITEPKQRLKFTFHNGHENFEYIINPTEPDLDTDA